MGQVFPVAVSFITTPLVIRMLGAEGYGVLSLLVAIPSYLMFADFGMNIASTRFAASAFADGDFKREASLVRGAATICLLCSLPFALLIFLLAGELSIIFNVPAELIGESTQALRITSLTLVLNLLTTVFNTPMLVRMRMDLNMLTSATFRIGGVIATPLVVYQGFGIIGVAWTFLIVAVLTLLTTVSVSSGLLRGLLRGWFRSADLSALLKFGLGYSLSGIAAVLLVGTEKFVLASLVSVRAIAYYSIALTVATMMTMLSGSMVQSLIPAFSQMQDEKNRHEAERLYSMSIRLILCALIPSLTTIAALSRPFLTVWAGDEFGFEATAPLRILLFGLAFNAVAYFPLSIVIASGRTSALARLYWTELLIYVPYSFLMVSNFSVLGAAIAWTTRAVIDSVALMLLAARFGRVRMRWDGWQLQTIGVALLLSPSLIFGNSSSVSAALIFLCISVLVLYGLLIWFYYLNESERSWLKNMIVGGVGRESKQ